MVSPYRMRLPAKKTELDSCEHPVKKSWHFLSNFLTSGFLLELKKQGTNDKQPDTRTLLSLAHKIHLVLVKTDRNSETQLLGSHYLDWRGKVIENISSPTPNTPYTLSNWFATAQPQISLFLFSLTLKRVKVNLNIKLSNCLATIRLVFQNFVSNSRFR